MTAKERDMGQERMQFTCSSFGQQGAGKRGAIKILQINYTKKKRQIIYKKSVQGHHFAVIICTNSAEEKGGKNETRLIIQ